MGQSGGTPQDPSLNNGMLASDNSIAQLEGDRNKKEGRASASHGNGRNGHSVQGAEAVFFALSVVELEGGYSLCYYLGFRISPVAEGLIFNEHKENERWAMDKTHTRMSDAIGLATNGEGAKSSMKFSWVVLAARSR